MFPLHLRLPLTLHKYITSSSALAVWPVPQTILETSVKIVVFSVPYVLLFVVLKTEQKQDTKYVHLWAVDYEFIFLSPFPTLSWGLDLIKQKEKTK